MSWRQVKLGELVDNFSVRAKDVGGADGLDFFGVSNEEGIIKTKYAAQDKAEDYKIIEKGCFAYNPYRINVGSIGLVSEDTRGLISPAYVIFKPKPQSIIPELLFKFLKSDEGLRQIIFYARGTVRQALRFEDLCNIELSIPDYAEQQGLYNKLINSQNSSNILDIELKKQLELVKKLRQQILQDAVQGKLVGQNNKDEPASALLKKIKNKKEKLIKQKKLKIGRSTEQSVSLINDIEIPNAWEWCKSDEIFFVTKLAGFEYSEHISLKESGEIPVVRAQNVRPLNIDKTNLLYIDTKTSATLERCALIKKCLLVTFIGAGIGDVATFEETERWHLAPNVAKMEPFEGCEELTNVRFLNYYLMSRLGQKEIFKHVKATAQPSLSMGTIRDIDFVIPPLAEQTRIVQKLDELMQFCNELEASIKESQVQNEKLLQQVLREALRKEPVGV
jgi:type I restriction enzyme S subunit